MAAVVNPEMCTACGICADDCPQGCFDMGDVAVLARPEDCTDCGICIDVCPNGAITL